MSKRIILRKGLNIRLKGEAEKSFGNITTSDYYAIKPTDFIGITPKMLVKEGDAVKAGSPVFFSKGNEEILFSSPVSGVIEEVSRGAKRRIECIRIKADREISYIDFGKADPLSLSREQVTEKLLNSGLWPMLRQRPYHVVANPTDKPKSIFVSGFDSSPLAPDYDFIVHGNGDAFQAGLNAMSRLTSGKIHLNVNNDLPGSKVFTNSKNVTINHISGPHPAGNVGVQIHHIDPINKGDLVWFVSAFDLITIGKLFLEGKYEASRLIALTGSEVLHPRYYKVLMGTCIKSIVENNIKEGNHRYISGNVLTGDAITNNGFLGFYHNQITVIPEGDKFEFLGWSLPGIKKYSASRTFLSGILPAKAYKIDTNFHGGVRAFVFSGQYEKYVPMDILPVYLLKSILAEDIELMENLGIYEVAEEDFALCEFACTSKIEVQEILRKGLDLMKKEMS
ncbi:MAG: Na(+)-translocating NADH-quinone reductase subunit A [Bacteroidetes bacterium]|nr:Na(+)-translocating NADH-quinone reductase subunit A [Bacteroidota bacterium]MBU1720115.1 Na(+)-translocating NADH-quinone reductase subunit A [Bacteroidota bacterium]